MTYCSIWNKFDAEGNYIWAWGLAEERKKLTIPDLAAKKAAGERLVMVAIGEVLSAAWAERAGV
ncbi:MAG: hypothetical protein VX955_07780, partial [Pseudomonadota bacterium]|nr:hypothetical protein [Pseudomonadota bacterium]